jgi:hypothetical protein
MDTEKKYYSREEIEQLEKFKLIYALLGIGGFMCMITDAVNGNLPGGLGSSAGTLLALQKSREIALLLEETIDIK